MTGKLSDEPPPPLQREVRGAVSPKAELEGRAESGLPAGCHGGLGPACVSRRHGALAQVCGAACVRVNVGECRYVWADADVGGVHRCVQVWGYAGVTCRCVHMGMCRCVRGSVWSGHWPPWLRQIQATRCFQLSRPAVSPLGPARCPHPARLWDADPQVVATWRGPQTCLCDRNIKTEIPRKGVCRVCPETDGREPSAPGVLNVRKCSVSGAGDLKGPRTERGAGCVRGSSGRRQGLPDAWDLGHGRARRGRQRDSPPS